MKKILVVLLFCASSAFAAPFIVSDPDPTGAADKCVYQVGTATAVETPITVVPPQLTGGCKIDTVVFPSGTTTMQVWFRTTLWGLDTAKAPFVLRKPAAGSPGPVNLRLDP